MTFTKEVPILEKEIRLERFSGKGGWTFVRLPEIPQEKVPFGLKKVYGFIDDYEIKDAHLMPMGNRQLFLPVKAEIRKKIKKEEGDYVKITLYNPQLSINIREDFNLCLEDDPIALSNFHHFSEEEKTTYFEYINSSKTEDQMVERMAYCINKISRNERL